MYDYGIFIFRKDLRIIDNRGLIKLAKACKEIIPIFIFDPLQIKRTDSTKNYLSMPAIKFLCQAISNLATIILDKQSKLYIFNGLPSVIIKKIIIQLQSEFKNKTIALGFNEDFTNYAIKRDSEITSICLTLDIPVITNDDDYTLCEMSLNLKDDGTPYKQYGAFRKKMITNKFNKVNKYKIKFYERNIKFDKLLNADQLDKFWSSYIDKNYKAIEIGDREIALEILKNIKKFKDYNDLRDTLSYKTTNLSAFLNFGLISEREFYYTIKSKLGDKSLVLNQIIWRDYYLTLLRYLPNAKSYDLHIDDRYNQLGWISRPTRTGRAWKEWNLMMNSKTGFLIIDAAIQEILTSGYMHNRARLIVGSFSVKYLQINPLCRYIGLHDWFSRHLVDCSTSQNKLNCQWISELDFPGKKFGPSRAPLAGRPMSINNIIIKKYDPECEYIKKWLPHLANIDNKILIGWDNNFDETIHAKPIFDPKNRYQEWIELCSLVK